MANTTSKYSGLAQVFDPSQIVQQAVQSQNMLAQQQAQIAQQSAQQRAQSAQMLSEQSSKFLLQETEQRIRLKREKDAAIRGLLDEMASIDMTGVRANHTEFITSEYSELENFVAENINDLWNPASNPDKYVEFKRKKNEIIKYIAKSKSVTEKIVKDTESLASNELYSTRWKANIQNINKLSTLSLDDENFSAIMSQPLKAGIDSMELAKSIGSAIQPDGGTYSIQTSSGKELLVVKDNKLSEEALFELSYDLLLSNNGQLAIGEAYDIDQPFQTLPEGDRILLAVQFADKIRQFIKNDIKVTNVTHYDSDGGIGAADQRKSVDLLPYALGENTFAGLSDNIAGAQMVSVPLNDGSVGLFQIISEKREGEVGTSEQTLFMGRVTEEGGKRTFSVGNISRDMVPEGFRDAYRPEVTSNTSYTRLLNLLNEQSGNTSKDKVDEETLKETYRVDDLSKVVEAQFNKKFEGKATRDWLESILAYEYSDESASVVSKVNGTETGKTFNDVGNSIMEALRQTSDKGDKNQMTIGVGETSYSVSFEMMSGNAFKVTSGSTVLLDKAETQGKTLEEVKNMLLTKISSQVRQRVNYNKQTNFFTFSDDGGGDIGGAGGGAPLD